MFQTFFKKNWAHFAVLGICMIVTMIYFSLQLDGYGLKQHDILQHKGSSHEIADYRERTGQETLWTNSMFGGMPSMQISLLYEGNYINQAVVGFVKTFPPPAGVVFLYMLGFYIFAMCLRINPWIGLFGALAFGFMTYNIIILQAGHNSKALATAFMAPVVGSFIMAYRRNMRWGIVLSALFMTVQLSMNHLQVSYYMLILLAVIGLVLFIEQAFVKKQIKTALLTSAGIIVAYLLAGAINYGNIGLTNSYAKHSIRGANDLTLKPDGTSNQANSTTGLNRDYVTEYSNGIDESFTLISPYVKGSAPGAIANTPFAETVDEMDLTADERENLLTRNASYWGDQTIVSGPAYMGIVVVVIAILAVVLIPSPLNVGILLVSLLALALSWGKNFMGLTDFFLDYIPGYNKFRAPTIIVVVIQLCLVILAALFLDKLRREREKFELKKKKFLITSGVIVVVLIGISAIGLGDGYLSERDREQYSEAQLEATRANIRGQLQAADPAMVQQQLGVNMQNEAQVSAFIEQEVSKASAGKQNLIDFRSKLFSDSMMRSIFLAILTLGAIALFFYTKVPTVYVVVGLTVLVAADLIGVDRNFLGNQDDGKDGYKYWEQSTNTLYPIPARNADLEILEMEVSANPALKKAIDEAERLGAEKAKEMEFDQAADERRVSDAYRFAALNRLTNYRVFDYTGGFSSAEASYFHKSLGGYHGAKLRNIQNVYEYHITQSNSKVMDMLNVKYLIKNTERGLIAEPNINALGNAWLVKSLKTLPTADDEIRALGNKYELDNIGVGQLVARGEVKKQVTAYGSEPVRYVLQGDTIDVPLSSGLNKGFEVCFVMDINGKTSLVPKFTVEADTANSFLKLVSYRVTEEFNPRNEAVILKDFAKGLKKQSFTGEGSIKMTKYEPNAITYEAKVNGDQFAVFSEIYYPEGWVAKIDGKVSDIRKVDYLLRGLEIPDGKHKIEFTFDLPAYKSAGILSAMGSIFLLLVIAVFAYMDFKKKKTGDLNVENK